MVLSKQGGGGPKTVWIRISAQGHVSITYYSAFCLTEKIALFFFCANIMDVDRQTQHTSIGGRGIHHLAFLLSMTLDSSMSIISLTNPKRRFLSTHLI